NFGLKIDGVEGRGGCGFECSGPFADQLFILSLVIDGNRLLDATLKIIDHSKPIYETSVRTDFSGDFLLPGKMILQMLGSGFNLLWQDELNLRMIGQGDFSMYLDLRKKKLIHTFQSNLYFNITHGRVRIGGASSSLSTGLGQADIRAITYKDGTPLLDQGRLWYTISVRGRALPHHLQGVFSLDPSVFDIRLEGVIVFDRGDGLLRNEISSHIFYDQEKDLWQGLTTGFSAYANPDEQKQILAIESQKDPRFGFSIMKARPTGIVGDIEDSHILYDADARKWRILTCENHDGYKAVILESNYWNRDYVKIAGPVAENSTGTSIQKIGNGRYCFAGSSDRKIYIYSYPDLQKVGTLNMDLPPWDDNAGTRIWPNVVMVPEGYPSRYVALMMDRYNFPGQQGPHWSYGALYLYFGYPTD
ncbi:MAG: hypothetical protein KDC53_21245, partial [Saprospiraceae bacterium]|nr:hypothetical protein [Saprospiraceae bacterium]